MNYPDDFVNRILLGDCLEVMRDIPSGRIDLLVSDLPYNATQNFWDVIIPLEPMWEQFKRITKDNAAIVLFANMRFAAQLIGSNPDMFKFDCVWFKNKVSGHLNAKKRPLTAHENILIFYCKPPTYHPQKSKGHKPVNSYTHHVKSDCYGDVQHGYSGGGSTERYPTSVWKFNVLNNDSPERIHPTQKPVSLIENIIKTYSNEGDIVLDPCIGSGTTAIAAINSGRNFIGIEKDDNYYKLANDRIAKHLT
jgi:DNA modification methylase